MIKMKLLKSLSLVLASLIIFSCGSKLSDNFHMEKRYWDVSDYEAALRQLKYHTPEEQGYPRLSDPLTAPVFIKLVDKENVSVVLEDEELGLKYKNELAQEYFDITRDVIEIYQGLDIQDKFIYPIELVKAVEFGLHTQLLYFKVGNDNVIKNAVNPEAANIKKTVRRNEQIIADNFKIYIDFLTKEDALNDEAKTLYAEMIIEYYSRLIEEFPKANYAKIKSSAKLISEKVSSTEIKDALDYIINKIDNK